jgi:hypothetical protein
MLKLCGVVVSNYYNKEERKRQAKLLAERGSGR